MSYLDLEIKKSASIREKELPGGVIANPSLHVFIPLDDTVQRIKALVALTHDGNATFIRAPVAAGKTTLARHLIVKYPNEFIGIGLTADSNEEGIRRKIIEASGISGGIEQAEAFAEALKAISESNRTIVVDEAHILFSFPKLCGMMLKAQLSFNLPNVLLFSAAATGQDQDLNSITTPGEIRKRYMWYPPIPCGEDLVSELQNANVYLSAESVKFFWKICCAHRGIFISVMQWVQKCQEECLLEWDIHQSVGMVRKSLEDSRLVSEPWSQGIRQYMRKSRAVHVNGNFSKMRNIPKKFAEVLFGGSKSSAELGDQERSLTINGFLMPERENNNDELVAYDWNEPSKVYGVSNSLMAEYYGDVFPSVLGYEGKLVKTNPTSGADLLARAIPFVTFSLVIDNAIPDSQGELGTSLSADTLPYEDHYNAALTTVFQKNYTVSTPLNPTTGKTDVVVHLDRASTCGIETIMATRSQPDHDEHAQRFQCPEKAHYFKAKLKVLLIIGSKETNLKKRMQNTFWFEGLEIIGLVVSQAHDSYAMYIRKLQAQPEILGPFFFTCDRVAKCLKPDNLGVYCLTSAQQLKDSNSKKRANSGEIKRDLKQLKELYNEGLLSKEVYNDEQKAILNSGH